MNKIIHKNLFSYFILELNGTKNVYIISLFITKNIIDYLIRKFQKGIKFYRLASKKIINVLYQEILFIKGILRNEYLTHTVMHICNSHKPTHNQKSQKSLSVCQRFFANPKNYFFGNYSALFNRINDYNKLIMNKVQHTTRVIKNCLDSKKFKSCSPLQYSYNLTGTRPQSATFHNTIRYCYH